MVAVRFHFRLCSQSETLDTSKIISHMNHSQLTFESSKVENGCRSPIVIQMQEDPAFMKLEESLPSKVETSVVNLSTNIVPKLNALEFNDEKVASPTRSNFSRSSTSTNNRSLNSHSRSAIYVVDDLAFENETQMQLESTPPAKNRSLIPFKSSSSLNLLSSSSSSNELAPRSEESIVKSQDPWNSTSMTTSNSISSIAPLKVSPKNPLRSKPYANKSKRPLTPGKKNKAKDQDLERPNTANSYTQRMAIAMESNTR